MFGLEATDVVTQRLYHLPTGKSSLHMIAREALGVVGIEGCPHGHNLSEFVTHGFDIFLLQHLGIPGCLIGILGIDIPTAEHQIGQTCQRYDILIFQILAGIAATDADPVVLRHGTNRLCQTLTGHQHACHECGGYCATTHYQDA